MLSYFEIQTSSNPSFINTFFANISFFFKIKTFCEKNYFTHKNLIDRILKNKNIFLILCGSEISVIEVLFDNSTKPLYGRNTADLKLLQFTYKEVKAFFPKYSNEEVHTVYSILGGMPLYLSFFDDSTSIREKNIKNSLSTIGYLFNEIATLLRMELTETSFYKNILHAINSGWTRKTQSFANANTERSLSTRKSFRTCRTQPPASSATTTTSGFSQGRALRLVSRRKYRTKATTRFSR